MHQQRHLRLVLDASPALCSYDRAYARAFRREVDDFVGREVREILGEKVFDQVGWWSSSEPT